MKSRSFYLMLLVAIFVRPAWSEDGAKKDSAKFVHHLSESTGRTIFELNGGYKRWRSMYQIPLGTKLQMWPDGDSATVHAKEGPSQAWLSWMQVQVRAFKIVNKKAIELEQTLIKERAYTRKLEDDYRELQEAHEVQEKRSVLWSIPGLFAGILFGLLIALTTGWPRRKRESIFNELKKGIIVHPKYENITHLAVPMGQAELVKKMIGRGLYYTLDVKEWMEGHAEWPERIIEIKVADEGGDQPTTEGIDNLMVISNAETTLLRKWLESSAYISKNMGNWRNGECPNENLIGELVTITFLPECKTMATGGITELVVPSGDVELLKTILNRGWMSPEVRAWLEGDGEFPKESTFAFRIRETNETELGDQNELQIKPSEGYVLDNWLTSSAKITALVQNWLGQQVPLRHLEGELFKIIVQSATAVTESAGC